MTTLNLPVVAFDVETTGLEDGSRLLHIAAQHFNPDSGDVLDTFDAYADPGMRIPLDAGAVNGITDDMVRDKLPAAHVLADFMAWLPADAILVAHWARYDVGIVSFEFERGGRPLPTNGVVCTCEMARQRKATKANNLDALVEHYGIQRAGTSHTAMSDADACRQVFLAMGGTGPVLPWDAVPRSYRYAPPSAFPSDWPRIDQLVRDATPIAFTYIDLKGVASERTLTPYGYANSHRKAGEALTVHGWCHLRQERRTFDVDRMANVRVAQGVAA